MALFGPLFEFWNSLDYKSSSDDDDNNNRLVIPVEMGDSSSSALRNDIVNNVNIDNIDNDNNNSTFNNDNNNYVIDNNSIAVNNNDYNNQNNDDFLHDNYENDEFHDYQDDGLDSEHRDENSNGNGNNGGDGDNGGDALRTPVQMKEKRHYTLPLVKLSIPQKLLIAKQKNDFAITAKGLADEYNISVARVNDIANKVRSKKPIYKAGGRPTALDKESIQSINKKIKDYFDSKVFEAMQTVSVKGISATELIVKKVLKSLIKEEYLKTYERRHSKDIEMHKGPGGGTKKKIRVPKRTLKRYSEVLFDFHFNRNNSKYVEYFHIFND